MEEKIMKKFGFLLLIFVLSLSFGCNDDDDNDNKFEFEETETLSWSTDGITKMVAITKNGAISVEATQEDRITALITKVCGSDSQADAEEHIDDIVISDEIDGNQIILEADMPDCCDRDFSADFEITSPNSIFFDITTVNGALYLGNIRAGTRMRTTNGAIATANHQGNINAATVNGAISCDVALLASGKSVVLSTANGAINLSLPSDVSATFNATTVNGTVTITGFDSISYTTDTNNHKSGMIGEGDATVTATVVNGDISIEAR
jgi:hypothetical protein